MIDRRSLLAGAMFLPMTALAAPNKCQSDLAAARARIAELETKIAEALVHIDEAQAALNG